MTIGDAREVDAIQLRPGDNVATVLHPVASGETVRVRAPGGTTELVAGDAIPLCHKISLVPLRPGETVLKYGQSIGEATQDVAPGRHVHTHNLRSARARPPA